jgi:hypothetical protein
MPAKSKILSEQISQLPREEVKPRTRQQVKELLQAQECEVSSDEEEEEEMTELGKRQLRALHAREYAIIETVRRYQAENPGKEFSAARSEYFCDKCCQMVCDCDTCLECDGAGPCFPSNKCERCHPNYSDYATDELGEELAAKYDKDPFFGSDSECDIPDFDCNTYEDEISE